MLIFISNLSLSGQNIDSLIKKDSIKTDSVYFSTSDSISFYTDSLMQDSIPEDDTLKLDSAKKSDDVIKEEINFKSADSMHISVGDKNIILFGQGNLVTESMELTADSVGIDMQKKELKAEGRIDSSGRLAGKPVFKDKDQEYTSKNMRYNFDTKKGLVHKVMTTQQEGFLHGQVVKIHDNNEMHILEGKYTTCDKEHPHFYIDLTKAKLKAKDKIITGPLYFVILDIPMPLWAPFGFFPLSTNNSSGIHFPTYADELDRGFGLVGTGYYWAINDYIDIDITGDVYSKGSWGLNLRSNIKKRYLFNSSINLRFFHYQNGEKILKTTEVNNSFSAKISYKQSPKALPNSSFSASINYVRGNIEQYNATEIEQFVKTNTNSSISYQKSFQGTPFRMTANMNLSQNLSDSTNSLRFPVVNFNMKRIKTTDFLNYFREVDKHSKGKWYQEIGLSLNTSLTNSVKAHDSIFYEHPDSLLYKMKSGFQYKAPLQTSFTIFKYFNVSPSFNFLGRVYANKIKKEVAGPQDSLYLVNDTIWGFNHVYDFNSSIGLSTKLFGLFKLNLGRLKAVRHVLSPSVRYTYTPDFSQNKWGYYEQNPLDSSKKYSYYQGFVYGSPSSGERQMLSFSLGNNFEAKISPGKDTTKKEKKIRLLNNLSLRTSYNFAADSMNLSNINLNGTVSPIPKINLGFGANFDPYAVNKEGVRIDEFEYMVNKKIARLSTAKLTMGTSFSNNDFFENKNKDKKSIKWNATFDYSFRFSKKYNTKKQEFEIDLTQNASVNFRISPTPLWRISVRSGYDFDASKVTSTTFNFYRDLHCWEMSLQVTPFGRMKSYMFKINVKATMFEALKFEKKRSWHDNF